VVVTDASGHADFTAPLAVAVPAGRVVTATATDPAGSTSELSGCSVPATTTTTTTSSTTSTSTTTTTTPVRDGEVCGNCADDDGDGLVDFDDAECCGAAGAAALVLRRGRLLGRERVDTLDLQTTVPETVGAVPLASDVHVQVTTAAGGRVLCAALPREAFQKVRRNWLFRDRRHRVPLAAGIEGALVRPRRDGTTQVHVESRALDVAVPLPGPLRVTLGFRHAATAEAGNACATATAPFRATERERGVRFP
jgi:hypothetical protein